MTALLPRFLSQRPDTPHGLDEPHDLRSHLALEASGAGTWVIDYTRGACEVFDARACELAGLDAGQAYWPKGTFCSLLHPDDRAAMQAAAQRTHASAGPGPLMEYRIVRADGQLRWLQGAGIVQRGPDGAPQQFIGVSIDITERKRLEGELRSTIQKLADVDQRKDVFLATLAHELRTPLAPISNGLQLLKLRAPADECIVRTTQMMERQVQHLVRLVDDLLDVSRIARGKAPLRRERLLLREVLLRALESTENALAAKGLELQVDIEPEATAVDGDRDRLIQVFSNLIANAVKFTAPGGLISVSLRHEGSEVVVSVRDTGVGIPAEALDTVFELFSQLGTVTSVDGGLGIGLALVRQLVRQHGGDVQARSEGPGCGSEFTVRLPVAAADASRPGPLAEDAPGEAGSQALRRVLVVDDNADAAASLAALLTLQGHQVHVAGDGVEAVDLARSIRPQVILMDLGMPRMDGLEAVRRIRAEEGAGQPYIVALTGWGQESDRSRTREAGFDAHLVKPVQVDTLRRILDAARA